MPATLICHPTELRPLSVKEYARVQQFPDSWQFSGKISDIYKQIGNAVPVGLGYMAGMQIIRLIMESLKEMRIKTMLYLILDIRTQQIKILPYLI